MLITWQILYFTRIIENTSIEELLHEIKQVNFPILLMLSHLTRIVWILVVCVSVACFLYLNLNNLVKYFKYPKSVNMEVTYRDELGFPAVTVCNYNELRWFKRFAFSYIYNTSLANCNQFLEYICLWILRWFKATLCQLTGVSATHGMMYVVKRGPGKLRPWVNAALFTWHHRPNQANRNFIRPN